MKIKTCGLLAALVVFLADSDVQASPIATLTLHSQPGDMVGAEIIADSCWPNVCGGEDLFVTYPSSQLGYFNLSAGDHLHAPRALSFTLSSLSTPLSVQLNFQTDQLGIPIQPGVYMNAVSAFTPMMGHPGLYVFGHNGCSTITGGFVITDATFLPDNTLSSFSSSFEQHCEGVTPALFGTFTYNANATEVPEPASYSFAVIGTVCLLFRWASALTWRV